MGVHLGYFGFQICGGGVKEPEYHLCLLDGLMAAVNADAFYHIGCLADSGGVDEGYRNTAQIGAFLKGVTGGSGDLCNYCPVKTEKQVQQT